MKTLWILGFALNCLRGCQVRLYGSSFVLTTLAKGACYLMRETSRIRQYKEKQGSTSIRKYSLGCLTLKLAAPQRSLLLADIHAPAYGAY